MTAEQIVTLLGAGGGGAVLLTLVNGLIKWLSGTSARERQKNTDLISQRRNAVLERDAAEKERDDFDRKRLIAVEYASTLRSQLIEKGIIPQGWPEEIDPRKRRQEASSEPSK